MTKDKALDLALEALLWANIEINDWRDDAHGYTPEDQPQIMEAITAIKQARSAPVQSCYCPNCEAMGKELAALKAQPAPVQEPVFCEYCGGNDDADFGLPTDHCTDCARPQPAAQRQWVGLTDEEFEDIELGCRSTVSGKIMAMQKVEAKLKEKNNG